jgi:hypothetical protein
MTCGHFVTSHQETRDEAVFSAHRWPLCGISMDSPSPVIHRQHCANGLPFAHIIHRPPSLSSITQQHPLNIGRQHSSLLRQHHILPHTSTYFHTLPPHSNIIDMSDNKDNITAAKGDAPQFTERELQLLGWAMQSLKSGPPEVCSAFPFPGRALIHDRGCLRGRK